jgi:hypothetical protein
MRWYMWVVFGILALNALAILVIGLFVLWGHLKSRRRSRGEGRREVP